MTRDELQLMQALRQACTDAAPFALRFMSDELSAAEELVFARRLAEVADAIRRHGQAKNRIVIDGDVTPPMLEADSLPPGGSDRER